jgi:hypothetical protein
MPSPAGETSSCLPTSDVPEFLLPMSFSKADAQIMHARLRANQRYALALTPLDLRQAAKFATGEPDSWNGRA